METKDVLFEQGDPSKGLYCINSGKIKLFKTDVQGHQKIVHIAGPGEMIGYRSMIAGDAYQATAECIESGNICFIEKKSFESFLQNDPALVMKLLKALAKNLGQAQTNELNLAHKHIDQRFADLLVYLGEKYGEKTSAGIKIQLSLSRQEIADFIGSTQESAIRIISTFKKLEIISVCKKQITITNPEKLYDLVG